MRNDNKISRKERRIQERKDFREYITVADKRVLDMKKSGVELIANDEVVKLSYWKTPEEAFEEYTQFKKADIMMMAAKYKNKIPKHVYEALLRYEIKPYVED